jgi:cobyrinic acid a,c-diamide synthase
LGFIPKKDGLIVPERHLGLVTLDDDREKTAAFLESAAEIIEENLDLAAVLEIARTAKPIQLPLVELKSREKPANVRLAVARDEAFCFYYAENLALLAEAGAEIVYFSPIHDPTLPDRIDGIYFGGGYPELHAPALSINESMLSAVRTFAVADHPIFAECGGLMYLTNVFQDSDRSYQMAGILSGSCRMGRRLIMGYRMATALTPNWLLAPAQTLRSHEFHYSIWDREDDDQPLFSYMNALGEACGTDGVCRGNTIASYSHIDFGQDETLVTNFITAMEKK